MKKTAVFFLAFFLLFATGIKGIYSEEMPNKSERDARRAVTENTRETRKIKTIFDYKPELGLSDDQTTKIKEALESLEKDVRTLRAKLTLVGSDMDNLLGKDASMDEIKPKIKEAYEIQASMRIADLETARKINSILTPEQMKKWKQMRTASKKMQ